ncbi:MAG: copper amine oxidase N-terminal domain-containing protein [Clostridiales bacterium]|nr:copper amine oxidase N-terminal domain-containing protein [Clostridiales bacterium]MCF8022835.1 copper amine oxidase N-terminal domain-containing protein [Clostridiales bacterium]
MKKLSFIIMFCMFTFTLFSGSAFAMPIDEFDRDDVKSYENTITYKKHGNLYVTIFCRYPEEWDRTVLDDYSKEQIQEFFKGSVETSAHEIGDDYANYQIVKINGVPWQNSPYRNLVYDNMDHYGGGDFDKYPELYEIAKDKRFNGRGEEVIQLLSEGKSIDEVQKAMGITGELQNSLNEKIHEENNISKESQEEEENKEKETKKDTNNYITPEKLKINMKADSNKLSISEDGTNYEDELEIAPYIYDGTTYVPVRGILDKFGVEIGWDGNTREVSLSNDYADIVLTAWNKTVQINGEDIEVDKPAQIKKGSTYLPLRFVSENLGYNVGWDSETKTVYIKNY